MKKPPVYGRVFGMKVKELKKVARSRVGYVSKNGVRPEPNEENTFNYLALFGFNIELIKPTRTQKVKNPDILIMGAVWEVKTPISSNKNTIKNRFREAAEQATKIIFDLRNIKKDADKVEKQIIGMFTGNGQVRHLMIIEKNGRLIDIIK